MIRARFLIAALLLGGMSPTAIARPQAPAGAPARAADPRLKALYDAEWAFREREFARLPGSQRGEATGSDHLPRNSAAPLIGPGCWPRSMPSRSMGCRTRTG